MEEAYYRYMEENPMAGILAEEQEELNVEYDNEGNIIYVEKNKVRTQEKCSVTRLLFLKSNILQNSCNFI